MYYKYLSLVFQNFRGTHFLWDRLGPDESRMADPLEGSLGPPGVWANPWEGRHKKQLGYAISRISVYAARTPPLRSGLSGRNFFRLSAAPTVLLRRAGAG